jgi:hypothetical protein
LANLVKLKSYVVRNMLSASFGSVLPENNFVVFTAKNLLLIYLHLWHVCTRKSVHSNTVSYLNRLVISIAVYFLSCVSSSRLDACSVVVQYCDTKTMTPAGGRVHYTTGKRMQQASVCTAQLFSPRGYSGHPFA